MKAVIVAGGKGERMQSYAPDVPKPLLPIGDRSIVEHQIALLARYEIRDVWLTVREGDLDVFREHLGDGKKWGVTLHYHTETEPLGTAGSVARLLRNQGDSFIVFYGDIMINMDLEALIQFHRFTGAAATLVVHPTDHPHDSDLVDLRDNGRVRAFQPKPRPDDLYCRNFGNAGAYVVSPRIAEFIPDGPSDFIRDVFPSAQKARERIFAYRTREYLKDAGTPQRLELVRTHWKEGRVERLHLDVALPAVFLDRDGTLCEYVPFLTEPEQMELLPGAGDAVRAINESEYLAVVITNQPVVARGLCLPEDIDRVHARMEMLLGKSGALLDGIYFCPHHPDAGFEGENPEYKISCECRKPGPDLVRRAVRDLNIDITRSVFVGDMTADIETGNRLGIETILLETGCAGDDGRFVVEPTHTCADVSAAVDLILNQHR